MDISLAQFVEQGTRLYHFVKDRRPTAVLGWMVWVTGLCGVLAVGCATLCGVLVFLWAVACLVLAVLCMSCLLLGLWLGVSALLASCAFFALGMCTIALYVGKAVVQLAITHGKQVINWCLTYLQSHEAYQVTAEALASSLRPLFNFQEKPAPNSAAPGSSVHHPPPDSATDCSKQTNQQVHAQEKENVQPQPAAINKHTARMGEDISALSPTMPPGIQPVHVFDEAH